MNTGITMVPTWSITMAGTGITIRGSGEAAVHRRRVLTGGPVPVIITITPVPVQVPRRVRLLVRLPITADITTEMIL